MFKAHDCIFAMRASKCPVLAMLAKEWKDQKRYFFDEESKPHTLPDEILARVSKVMLIPHFAKGLDIPPAQYQAMMDVQIVVKDEGKPLKPIKAIASRARKIIAEGEGSEATGVSSGNTMIDGILAAELDTAALLNRAIENSQGNAK